MTISLSLLFEAINQVKDEHELRSQLVAKIGEYFAAKRSRIFFFDQLPLAGLKPAGNVIKLQKIESKHINLRTRIKRLARRTIG